jgi:hypothetical protein
MQHSPMLSPFLFTSLSRQCAPSSGQMHPYT